MYEQILNGTALAVVRTDDIGTITMLSEGASLMMGYSAEELEGKQNILLFHDTAELDNEVKNLLNATKVQKERLLNFAHIVSHNLRSHSGNFSMLLSLFRLEFPDLAASEMVRHLNQASCNLSLKKHWVLSVADNGLGIDLKRYGSKLFGIYKTFHGNTDARGVGLFITRNQVQAMSGEIWVESTPDIGTTFKIRFI